MKLKQYYIISQAQISTTACIGAFSQYLYNPEETRIHIRVPPPVYDDGYLTGRCSVLWALP
jgi:hypothetical protein